MAHALKERVMRLIKKILVVIVTLLALAVNGWANGKFESTCIFHVATGKETPLAQAVPDLTKHRIILVGEHHNRKDHHMAQLRIIQALHESGVPVAVGLEMFRNDSQGALDRWVGGQMTERAFQQAYYDNWTFPWVLYSLIFEYARQMKIPLVGLNVPRAITRQVAERGFQSLSEEQKGKLPDVTCRVDREYMAFIKRAYGAHAHGQLNFTYFCEAQLVWDKAMAISALEYLKANPTFSMVLLAGTGHAWKKGIPEQITQRSKLPITVILPEITGNIEPGIISHKDADYLFLPAF